MVSDASRTWFKEVTADLLKFLIGPQEVLPPKPVSKEIKELEAQRNKHKEIHQDLIWRNVMLMLLLHVAALHGLYLLVFQFNIRTAMWAYLIAHSSALGVTAGAHRLWSHKAYKAKVPLRVFLMLLDTLAIQTPIFEWCRDHRVHHKFSETDADPHNIQQGFFFAHCGWLMRKKHPEVTRKGKLVDVSDLWADPVVRIQRRIYFPLLTALFISPCLVPTMWGESLWNSIFVVGFFRYVVSLHGVWSVNSVAHMFGDQPYDHSIHATQNAGVALIGLGEGWHNYHHVFPWDYQANELGWKLNFTAAFIDAMAKIGQAYDLRRATPEMVNRRKEKAAAQYEAENESAKVLKVE